MTEQEAIKKFKERLSIEDYREKIPEYYTAMEMAVSALEEIQQYRALGTVEDIKALSSMEIEEWKKLKRYRDIGTVEEIRKYAETAKRMLERNFTTETIEEYMKFEDECVQRGFSFKSLLDAMEKQREKKPEYRYLKSLANCPTCGEPNLQIENEYGNVVENYSHCPDCGQAIDWSGEETEE